MSLNPPEAAGRAREFVREHFLLTRHLREYLTLFAWRLRGEGKHTFMV